MIGRITEVVGPVLETLALKLVEVEYKEAGPRSILRIFVDKPGGVTIDDCVEASREINVRLDVEDMIPHKYTLEVSSPGLTRRLRGAEDFENAVGKRVKVVTKEGCFVGQLVEFKGETAELVTQGRRRAVRLADIEKANLELDPDILSRSSKRAEREE
jgi:ribosome maturation factor RimP